MPRKKTKINPEDLAVFHTAVANVRRHAHNKTSRLTVRPEPPFALRSVRSTRLEGRTEAQDERHQLDLPPVSSETPLSYKHVSISNKILRKLRKGEYNTDAILDLHGLTVAKAEMAMASFIYTCVKQNIRTVLIVHGKGRHDQKPVLKNQVNAWLRMIDDVLAFCSARVFHGGCGAVYVLLKDRSEENDS